MHSRSESPLLLEMARTRKAAKELMSYDCLAPFQDRCEQTTIWRESMDNTAQVARRFKGSCTLTKQSGGIFGGIPQTAVLFISGLTIS